MLRLPVLTKKELIVMRFQLQISTVMLMAALIQFPSSMLASRAIMTSTLRMEAARTSVTVLVFRLASFVLTRTTEWCSVKQLLLMT